MTITLPCPCGKRFNIKDELAGRRVRCPVCGNLMDVPTVVEAEEVVTLDLVAQSSPVIPLGDDIWLSSSDPFAAPAGFGGPPAKAPFGSPTSQFYGPAKQLGAPAKKGEEIPWLWIGVGGGGLVAVLCLFFLVRLFTSGTASSGPPPTIAGVSRKGSRSSSSSSGTSTSRSATSTASTGGSTSAPVRPIAAAADGRPVPPLNLTAPPAPGPPQLSSTNPQALSQNGAEMKASGNVEEAIRAENAAVRLEGGSTYNLACYYGVAGKIDASLYWLQKGALDEGFDVDWAEKDSDLAIVRRDPRWDQLRPFLQKTAEYWLKSDLHQEVVIVPIGYQPGKPIPVLVGMHGMGSCPRDFLHGGYFQLVANQEQVAFVIISGTVPRGKNSFTWTPEPEKNQERISAALKFVAAKVTPLEGQIILFGFSQGGQVSAEIAPRDPARFAGAIFLSPGGVNETLSSSSVPVVPAHKTQGYVGLVNGDESPGNVRLTRNYTRKLESTYQARVTYRPFPGEAEHSFPPDFDEKFPSWIKFVLQGRR